MLSSWRMCEMHLALFLKAGCDMGEFICGRESKRKIMVEGKEKESPDGFKESGLAQILIPLYVL
jgi:hypothetical protein